MNNNLHANLINSLKSKIEKSMKEGEILGLSATIVQKSGPIWIESFGYINNKKEREVDENTLFSLQSVTKTITAVVFLLAVQKELVKLDDLVINYYPEFRMNSFYGNKEYKKITFRQLLSHTASLPREARIGGCFSRKLPDSFEEHIQSVNNSWLQNPVGSKYRYSNIGMDLVPYLLEKIVKKPYASFVQEVLGNELGIKIHWSIKEIYEQENTAKGYLGDFEAHKLDGVAFGCGGAFLPIKDQVKYLQFLLNQGKYNDKVILKQEYFDIMQKARDDSGGYGLGTTINLKHGTKLFSHAGGGFGYGAELYWIPEYDLGIALFDNSENGHFYSDYSIQKVVDEFLAESLELLGVNKDTTRYKFANEKTITLPIEKLQRLEGNYESNFFSFKIKEEDGKLYYMIGGAKIELQANSEVAFTTKAPNGIIFKLDEGEKPRGCRLYHSEEGLLHCRYLGKDKEIKLPPPKSEWKQYTGIYYQNYYYTEYNFSAISLDNEGYLQFQGTRLIPNEKVPNVFVNTNGVVLVFGKDQFYYDNLEYTRMDDILKFYTNIVNNEPNHRAAMPWIFDDGIVSLKQLGRNEEAERLSELKKEYFSKEKKES